MAYLRLQMITLANYASFSKSGGLNISETFDEIYTQKLPVSYPRFFLVLSVEGKKPESLLTVDLEITGPKGEVVLQRPISVVSGKNKKGSFILEIVGLTLSNEGNYTISVFHKTEEIGYTNFAVLQKKKRATTVTKIDKKWVN